MIVTALIEKADEERRQELADQARLIRNEVVDALD
jgi:hypothetical protein